MSNFERMAGGITAQVRVVRAIVEKMRVVDENRAKALAALAYIEGMAMALTSVDATVARKRAKPVRDSGGTGPR